VKLDNQILLHTYKKKIIEYKKINMKNILYILTQAITLLSSKIVVGALGGYLSQFWIRNFENKI